MIISRRRRPDRVHERITQTKFRHRVLSPQQEERLVALVIARPDATLAELRDALPTAAALSTLWRTIGRRGFTVKKPVHADEQRRADVAAARRRWQNTLTLHDARGYVFLDESGIGTALVRRYGRSPQGCGCATTLPVAIGTHMRWSPRYAPMASARPRSSMARSTS